MERKGIDISYYQGNIDFEKLKDEVDFVIIRCGFGGNTSTQDDKNFVTYANECTRLNIPFGVYLYSYAVNQSQAISEAEHTLRLIAPYQLEYPVYLDVESKEQSVLSTQELTDIVITYCNQIEKAGYYVGIYSNLNWFRTKFNLSKLTPYDKWLAQWSEKPTFQEPFGMWQYSSNGAISGITGRVDMNIAYKDYPLIIKENNLNHWNTVTPPPEENTNLLKFHVGDRVLVNGYLYKDSYGNGPGRKEENSLVTITSINTNERATKPYNIDNGLGWVAQDDLILYLEKNELTPGTKVQIILPGKASKDGSGKTAWGIGYKRQILSVDLNAKFPYQVGNTDGTTGYYKKTALKIIH